MTNLIISVILALTAVAPVMPKSNNIANIVEAKTYLEVEDIPHLPEDYVLDITDTITDNKGQPIGQAENNKEISQNLSDSKVDPSKTQISEMIKKAFPNDPVMLKVASCESVGLRHYVNGEVLRGEQVKEDTGLFQVNLTYWGKELKKKGIDPLDIEGNIKAARYIYEKQGLNAWSASANCWLK